MVDPIVTPQHPPVRVPQPLPTTVALNPPMVGVASPFERVDGQNRDLILEAIRAWMRGPFMSWSSAWQEDLTAWLSDTNNWLDDWNADVVRFVQESLADQDASVDLRLAALRLFVEGAVESIINSSITVQDPVIAGVVESPSSLTFQALARRRDLRNPMRHVKEFGVVGDGQANDTAAFETAAAAAVAGRFALYSDYGTVIKIDAITLTQGMDLEGSFSFKAATDNQPHMLKISRGLPVNFHDWRAKVVFDGDGKALDGLVLAQAGRTYVEELEVRNMKRWGAFFAPLQGNNNFVVVGRFRASYCGESFTMDAVQLTATANVATSSAGYGVFQLPSPVSARVRQAEAVYFVSMNREAYKVRDFTSDATLNILNLDVGNGNTATIKMYSGGGINIPRYGDNGVGAFGAMDIFSNPGIGIHISSLYGHTLNDVVAQSNGIGFAVWDYTKKLDMAKPYFELNDIDVAIWNYTEGVVTSPLSDFTKWQRLISRAGGSIYDIAPAIHIIDQQIGGGAPYVPATNAGARSFRPGDRVALHRTAGDSILNIDNSGLSFALGWNVAKATITRSAKTRTKISVGLTVNKGETVMGLTPYVDASATAITTYYEFYVHGGVRVEAFRIGSDWRVAYTPIDDTLTLTAGTVVSEAPSRIGQLANVGAVGYMAVGTAAGDFKQITN